jgi:hypothetical protein
MRLTELYDRVEACRELYWSLPKGRRIEHGLRPDVAEGGYSGAAVISFTEDLLRKGLRGVYPFETDYMWRHANRVEHETVNSPVALVEILEPLVADLEARLASCVTATKGYE